MVQLLGLGLGLGLGSGVVADGNDTGSGRGGGYETAIDFDDGFNASEVRAAAA
jgi:hypothetical protein